MLSSCLRRLSAIRGTAWNTLLPSVFPTKGGHYDFNAYACVTGKWTLQGGILGCVSATRRHSSNESRTSLRSTPPSEFRAIVCLYDYRLLEKLLELRGITLENMSTIKKENLVINKNDFLLLIFFSLPLPKYNPSLRGCKAFDAKNLFIRATCTEEEFEFLLQELRQNPALVSKCDIRINDIEIQIAKLRSIRQSVLSRYEFVARKQKK